MQVTDLLVRLQTYPRRTTLTVDVTKLTEQELALVHKLDNDIELCTVAFIPLKGNYKLAVE